MIELKKVSKSYRKKTILRELDLKLGNGRIFGLVGEPGAGKSTLLSIISGVTPADSGDVIINGYNMKYEPSSAKGQIGYIPEGAPTIPGLGVREQLEFVAEAKGVAYESIPSRVSEVMRKFSISELAEKSGKSLSMFDRLRLGLGTAYIGFPDTLIVDEPISGLSEKQMSEAKKLLLALGKEKTLLIATESQEFAEAICDTIITLGEGHILSIDSRDQNSDAASGKKEDI